MIVHPQEDTQGIAAIDTRLQTNATTGVDPNLPIVVMIIMYLVRDLLLDTGQIALALRVTRGEVTRLLYVVDIHVLRLCITTIILRDIPARPSTTIMAKETQEKPTIPSDDVIKSLGKRITNEKVYAPPVNDDIALRIANTIESGLPETEVKALRKEYLTPSTCKIIDPPEFNE